MKKQPGTGVVYLDRGPIPVFIGVCLSQRAWDAEMTRLGVDGQHIFSDEDAIATTHHLAQANGKGAIAIICLDKKKLKGDSVGNVFNTISHECAHVMQIIEEYTGGYKLGVEMEAYIMGWLAESVLEVILPKLARQKL